MQGDFILSIRAEMEDEDGYARWLPETLLYLFSFISSFGIFAKAISSKYVEKVKCLLGIEKKGDLVDLLAGYKDGSRYLPRWKFESINPYVLLGFDSPATKP